MARQFTAADNEYLYIDSALVSSEPLSMACWFYANNVTSQYALMWVGDKDHWAKYHYLWLDGATGGDPVACGSGDGTDVAHARTTTGYSATTWHHAAAVWAASNDRAVYIDGGSKGTENTDQTVDSIDRFSVAVMGDSSPAGYLDGRVAEAALWNVALSDAEVAILAKGYSPLLVHPQNLVGYWALIGRCNPEIDLVGAYDLTLVSGDSGPVAAAHPRVLYAARPFAPVPAAGIVIPLFMHHFRQLRAGNGA